MRMVAAGAHLHASAAQPLALEVTGQSSLLLARGCAALEW